MAGDSNRTEKYALERTAVWCQHCRGQEVGIPVEESGVAGKRKAGDCFRMMKKEVKRDAFLS
jgi:hypothetical protein